MNCVNKKYKMLPRVHNNILHRLHVTARNTHSASGNFTSSAICGSVGGEVPCICNSDKKEDKIHMENQVTIYKKICDEPKAAWWLTAYTTHTLTHIYLRISASFST